MPRITALFWIMLLFPSLWGQELSVLEGNALAVTYEEGWNTRSLIVSFRKEQASLPWATGLRVYGLRNSREQLSRPSEIYTQPGRRFVYGKTHRVLAIVPYFEAANLIIKPAEGQLFDIQLFGQIGPIVGLDRPYYVNVFQATGGGGPGQPVSGISVPTAFEGGDIDYIDIIGRSQTLNYGWDEMQVRTGASLRLGARIGLARRPEFLTELVFSVQGDYLFQPVTVMITDPDQQLFVNVGLGLVIGSRW